MWVDPLFMALLALLIILLWALQPETKKPEAKKPEKKITGDDAINAIIATLEKRAATIRRMGRYDIANELDQVVIVAQKEKGKINVRCEKCS